MRYRGSVPVFESGPSWGWLSSGVPPPPAVWLVPLPPILLGALREGQASLLRCGVRAELVSGI